MVLTSFYLWQSRNMFEQFKKAFLHRPIKILHFHPYLKISDKEINSNNLDPGFIPETLKDCVGVQRGHSHLTAWGEGASSTLVSDGVTIKMPYGVDVLH